MPAPPPARRNSSTASPDSFEHPPSPHTNSPPLPIPPAASPMCARPRFAFSFHSPNYQPRVTGPDNERISFSPLKTKIQSPVDAASIDAKTHRVRRLSREKSRSDLASSERKDWLRANLFVRTAQRVLMDVEGMRSARWRPCASPRKAISRIRFKSIAMAQVSRMVKSRAIKSRQLSTLVTQSKLICR